jgi:predicted kinase
VIVSGAPGSGKSTLAARLGDALHLPLLMKDTIKEALLDTLGAPTRERSGELSRAAYAVLGAVAAAVLHSDSGVVVEANFRRGTSEPEMRQLLAHARGVQVHCAASREVIERRYRERTGAHPRHPGHFDSVMLPEVLRWLDEGICEPLDLAVPLVRVETSDDYRPSFDLIMKQVRDA